MCWYLKLCYTLEKKYLNATRQTWCAQSIKPVGRSKSLSRSNNTKSNEEFINKNHDGNNIFYCNIYIVYNFTWVKVLWQYFYVIILCTFSNVLIEFLPPQKRLANLVLLVFHNDIYHKVICPEAITIMKQKFQTLLMPVK